MKTLLPILRTKLFLLGFVSTCTVILATTVPQIRNFIAPEKAIGEKIVTEQKKIASKIKKQNKTVSSSRVTSGLSLEMNNSFTATVTSDAPDYAPRSTATFTGAGFAPNEEVILKVKNLSYPCNTIFADSSYLPWTATADENGDFVTTWTVCDCPGDSLRLKATGQTSTSIAYAYFTDGSNDKYAPTISPTSVCNGASQIFNLRITNTGGGSSRIRSVVVTIPGLTLTSISGTAFTSADVSKGVWTNESTLTELRFKTTGSGTDLTNGDYLRITFTTTMTTGNTWITSGFAANNYTDAATNTGTDPTVTVNPNPTLTGATTATVCANSGAIINLTGLVAGSTSTINYTINGAAQTPVTGVVANGSGAASFTSANLTAVNNGQTLRITSVTITSATPNCTTTFTQDVILSVNPNPTLTGATQAATVCANSGATINLTGLLANSTSTINYTINGAAQTPVTGVVANGSGAASFTSANLTAANNGQTLRITGVTVTSATPNCTASFTQDVTLSVNPNPTLTGATQAAAVCANSGATINLTGLLANSTSTINYTINGAAQTPITGVVANGSGAASFTSANLTAANNGQTLRITSVTVTSATPNCTTSFTQDVTLAVRPNPTLAGATQAAAVCANSGAIINLTGLVAGSTSTINYTINGAAQTPITGVVANGSGAASFTSANLTAANNGQTLRITSITITSATPNCTTTFTQDVTLSVNPNPTLTGATQAATVCANSGATINLTGLLTNSTSTINYTINGAAQTPITGVVANGSGAASFTSANLTAANNGQTLRITGVTVTSATPNCTSSFTQDVTLSVNPNPTLTGATQAAAICAGSLATINLTGLLANSTSTINYTINAVAQTPATGVIANGAGAASFATPNLTAANNGQTLQITSVTTTSATPNCTTSFTQNVTLTVRPNPTLTGATQAATVCSGSGATINLTGLLASSTSTINYTINGVAQTPVTSVVANGSGAASFTTANLTAANNGQTLQITSVTTTSATPNCTTSFAQDVTLSVNPNPTLSGASQASAVCAGSGATINLTGLLASSTSTINYTINGAAQTPVTGVVADGSGNASFTSANLTAANNGQTLQITSVTTTSATPNCTTSFTQNITLSVRPNPTLTGASQAAAVCAGSSATINLTGLLANSTSTINYTINGVAQIPVTGVVANGSGAASFTSANLTAANNGQTLQITSVTTTSATPNCITSFTQNVTLIVRPNPTLTGASQAAPVCAGSGATINLTGLLANSTSTINYTINAVAQTPATGVVANGAGTASFTTANLTAANNGQTLQITSVTITSATPNCTTSFTQNVTLSVNPLPTVFNVGFTGSLCGTAIVTLDGSETGVNYTLFKNASSVETVSGTGSGISFSGVTQTGTYTVVATNTTTNCQSTMSGSVVMGGGSPPATFTVTGGGAYCFGGVGVPVGLSGSETGVNYQLYLNANPVGSPVPGTNSALSFGNQTGVGTYTVIGTRNNGSGCAVTMPNSVQVSIDQTPPTISANGTSTTLGCNPSASDINAALGTASASDNCGTPTVTQVDGAVTGDCNKSQTRTFTATDNTGKTASTFRTVTWKEDHDAPVITASGSVANNSNLGCNPGASAINAALGSATASDHCDGVVSVTPSDGTVTGDCNRSQTRTWTTTDICGNTSSASRTITWKEDHDAPVITATGSVANNSDLGCNPSASVINAALGSATASDHCDGVVSVTPSDGTVTGDCNRSQTRTWTTTDICGNTSSASRTITWKEDHDAPVITASGSVANNADLGCNPGASVINAALGSATASDHCDGVVSVTPSDGTVTGDCNRSQTRTWTTTDICGNTSSASRTITWKEDHDAPVITASGSVANNADLGCNPGASVINAALGSATASDHCDGVVSVTPSDGAVTGDCNRSQTRTWTTTDICGNTSLASRTITWKEDHDAPVITATGSVANNSDLGCNPGASVINAALGSATASDHCDGVVSVTPSDGTVTGDCNRSQTRTWTTTDICGNTSSTSRTITWKEDHDAPVITASGSVANNADLGCNPGASVINAALGSATASDHCDGVVSVTPSDGTVTGDCNRSQTRTWTTTDICGNTSSASRTITWKEDHDAPVITASGSVANNSDLGCNPSAATIDAALGSATASDHCDGVVTATPNTPVATGDCIKSQTRTWTTTDICGNTSSASRTITWKEDHDAPVITASGSVANNADLGCNPSASAIDAALGSATASDHCDGVVTATPNTPAATGDCIKSQTRTWTTTDLCGNTSSASRTITWKEDHDAPVITASGSVANNADLGCNPSASAIDAALGSATASDHCDGVVTATPNTPAATGDCIKSQTRTWTTTDLCGNTSSASRTITWKEDHDAPVITASGSVANNADLGCNPSASAIDAALGSATASDHCDGVVTATPNTPAATGDCIKSQTRTWTTTDICSNTSSASRTITWKEDHDAPVITASGSVANNADLGCNPSASAIDAALGSATASDHCDGVVTATPNTPAATGDCIKSQTRTWTTTDLCGNTSSASRTITWTVDVNKPVFTGSYTAIDLDCNPTPAVIQAALGSATATDGCSTPTVDNGVDGNVSTNYCQRSQTRTFTATDHCGNTQTASRTVTWTVDVTKPVFTGSYIAIDLDCNPTAAVIQAALGSATATDGCSTPTVDNGVDGNVSTNYCQRSQTRTFTATDHCGNTQTASRTVTWTVDVTKPVFTGSYTAIDLDCNPTAAVIQAALGSATATDGCSTPTVDNGVDGNVSTNYCQRSQTRTFTATDHCGNTQTASRTVTWTVDVTKPVFTGSYTAIDLDCNPTPAVIQAALGSATATDGCSTPTVDNGVDGNVSTNYCQRSQTRTFTATDHCGNTQTASRTVTWTVDVTKPVFTGSYIAIDLDCNPTAAVIQAALGSATATDGCSTPTVDNGVDGNVSTNYCQRSQTRTFTATDHCGNTQTASRTVTWTVDVTKPVFTGSYTAIDLDCNPTAAVIQAALGSATATDGCSTPTVDNGVDGNVSTNYCQRSQTRTFTATDHCGNTQTASRTVTWTVDVTKPVFTGSYTAIDLDCNPTPAVIQAALGSATATDGCSTPTVDNGVDGNVSTNYCQRSQTRTFTATDHCGNTQTASRTVTWTVDVTKPVFTGSYTAIDLDCNPTAAVIQAALGSATATDGCSTPTVNNGVDGNVSTNYCQRSQTRTFTATDHCGNTQTASRTVTWTVDVTKPVFTGSYIAIDLDCNPTAAVIQAALGSATATDGCSTPTVNNGVDGNVSTNYCQRSQTRTFTATDHCGNTQTASRTVTWTVDVTKPVFTGSYTAIDLDCNPTAAVIQAALGSATATDGCSTPTVDNGVDGNVSTNYCQRSQTRTFTATDHCGNTQTASRTVTWKVDLTKPTIPAIFVSQSCLWPPNHKMVDIYLTAATDGCGAIASNTVTVTSNEPANDIGDGNTEVDTWVDPTNPLHIQVRAERSGVQALVTPDIGRIYTVSFTATDACGNTSTAVNTITVAHNITSPNVGNSFKLGTTVSLGGTFWDVPGNIHTAKWVIDAATVNGTIVSEPVGNKMGKVSGSYKPTSAGIYKLRMNVTDQKGVTGYATTNGDYEAFLVIYDPNGGYTFGGGKFVSPANAAISNPGMTGQVAFGFASNYFKNATNPKGETELVFKDGGVEFNAVNYDVLVVDPTKSKATYKGLGKTIINGVEQSGYAFLMTVIDGKTPTNLNGTDKIRIKIYNKNTLAIIYDNQPGASDDADPITPVDSPLPDGSDIVVVNTPTGTSADITRNVQMESTPEITKFNVKVFPNPSQDQFSLYLEGANNDKVHIVVYDALGREVKKFEKEGGNIPVIFGRELKGGAYFVEVRQGENHKTIKLIKQN